MKDSTPISFKVVGPDEQPTGRSHLDLVAGWFWKGAQYIAGTASRLAFVATSSIVQGEQVALLWPSIHSSGVKRFFAYEPFKWRNSARDNAAVSVVIIGLSYIDHDAHLYRLLDDKWMPKHVRCIGPYLNENKNTVVYPRKKPIFNVSPFTNGSIAADGGNLILNETEKKELIEKYPISKKWILPYIGANDIFKGTCRFCLWLDGETRDNFESIKPIANRIDRVKKFRLKSSKKQTIRRAETPHLFTEIRQPLSGGYIAIPRTSSERRKHLAIPFLNSDVIANNDLQIVPNATKYEFGILSSEFHMDWLRLVGGRLESRYRYSAGLVYNTFPWPDPTDTQRATIEARAQDVLDVRERYFHWTMAEMYDPHHMPSDLLAAHQALDTAVAQAYRKRPFRDQDERQQFLLKRYETLVSQETEHA